MISGKSTGQNSPALRRLAEEDAVGQLRRRDGLMATLGSENGDLKLDWVEGVARLLADATKLEEVEAEARAIWQSGIRHIIWAGMGGSVLTVRVLAELNFCSGQNGEHIAIYPLDSTDPAALNAIVRQIAQAKHLSLPTGSTPADAAFVRTLLSDVMMIGVSMGMTSEEPITHLTWFAALLEQAQLSPAEHILVMTLPGSYLDQFANARQAPSRPLQLDGGTGTGGRMSAPATRVFLLPAALYLTRLSDRPGQLRATLSKAWQNYNLDLATTNPAQHPFVQLAVALYDASVDGACRLLVEMPGAWRAIVAWIEQLMEESLGKGGKGVVVFTEMSHRSQAACFNTSGTLHVRATANAEPQERIFALHQPYLFNEDPLERLAATAASFLGWQLSMALYGYLHHITFAGQPAVENYKARARQLRTMDDPLQVTQNWPATVTGDGLTLLTPANAEREDSPASTFASALLQAASSQDERTRLLQYPQTDLKEEGFSAISQPAVTPRSVYLEKPNTSSDFALGYLDLTLNGEAPVSLRRIIATHLYTIGNTLLKVPVKPRHAPADYHSTEQSEMDGPPYLVSLRLLLREHEESIIGTYTDAFLHAQAVSTWQAMIEQGRSCYLLLIAGSVEQAAESLERFFADVEQHIRD